MSLFETCIFKALPLTLFALYSFSGIFDRTSLLVRSFCIEVLYSTFHFIFHLKCSWRDVGVKIL